MTKKKMKFGEQGVGDIVTIGFPCSVEEDDIIVSHVLSTTLLVWIIDLVFLMYTDV